MQRITNKISIQQSQLWATNTGIIDGPFGAILVDPGIFESEFESIAAGVGSIAAGFVTHAHWDHVLWHRSLGVDTPRFATVETIALIQKDRNRILKNLSDTEQRMWESGEADDIELWDRDLLFAEQPISWGQRSIAGIDVELIPVPGHEDGQAALLLSDHGALFAADTLSDIETPSVYQGSQSIAVYLQTLDRLQSAIDRVDWIIPGHGTPANREEAQRRLDADRRYLERIVPMAGTASAGEGAADLARRILVDLGDQRAESELAWSMHLDNVQQLIAERERRDSEPPVRRSSRIILLDSESRVWMLRINDPVRPRWILPGGGLEVGESWEEAARRELWEECAINDAAIGPMVATRERLAEIDMVPDANGLRAIEPTWILAQERYFVVRLDAQQPNITNMFDYETEDYTRQAWLSANEIRASHEVVYPIGLANLLDQLARGEVPSDPWVWPD